MLVYRSVVSHYTTWKVNDTFGTWFCQGPTAFWPSPELNGHRFGLTAIQQSRLGVGGFVTKGAMFRLLFFILICGMGVHISPPKRQSRPPPIRDILHLFIKSLVALASFFVVLNLSQQTSESGCFKTAIRSHQRFLAQIEKCANKKIWVSFC